jgi:two-component system phosphate regulon sensor histidine kinase PhoR
VLDQQRPAAGSRTLTLDSAEERLIITCDPLRIRQVLTNLISNAIKYTPPESNITVRLHCGTEPPSETHPATHPVVVMSVHDEGAGIPPAQQARLFQRYYRARVRRAEGLGLGLYLSRQFVQMHGGTIWVESVEGVGSTFAFSLPLRDEGSYDTG